MARPTIILLDEPSMGLAPQLVEEIFEIVRKPQPEGAGQLPAGRAEHQRGAALRQTTATSWRTAASCWTATPPALRENEDVKEFYLGISGGRAQELPRRQALQAAQALARLGCHPGAYHRDPAIRARRSQLHYGSR